MNDVMRVDGRPLDDEIIQAVKSIKIKGHELHAMLETFDTCDKRMMALAKTNLEQAIMWASKALT